MFTTLREDSWGFYKTGFVAIQEKRKSGKNDFFLFWFSLLIMLLYIHIQYTYIYVVFFFTHPSKQLNWLIFNFLLEMIRSGGPWLLVELSLTSSSIVCSFFSFYIPLSLSLLDILLSLMAASDGGHHASVSNSLFGLDPLLSLSYKMSGHEGDEMSQIKTKVFWPSLSVRLSISLLLTFDPLSIRQEQLSLTCGDSCALESRCFIISTCVF